MKPAASGAGWSRPVGELLIGILLVAFAAATAVGLLLWAAGELAALVTRSHPSGTPVSAALHIGLRLPGHLRDPAAAWPARNRTGLAGAVPFYITAAVLLGLMAAAAVWVLTGWQAWRAGHGCRLRDRSRSWATTRQVNSLFVRTPTPGRVLLGRLGRRLVAAEARRSVLVVAPTQAGKTSRFVVPNVLRWTGPLLVTSVKGDVLRLTAAERTRRGRTHVFDPTGSAGVASCRWSPLLACTTYAGAERVAGWLVAAAGESHTDPNVRFWESLGGKLLAPLLFAAACTGAPISQVARWVDRREVEQVVDALLELADEDAIDAFTASQSREDRQRESVYATAETVLRAFTSPSARAATDVVVGEPDVLDVEALLDHDETLYLVAPAHEQHRLRPLFEALVQTVVRAAQDRYAASGVPLDPPLLLMLDEAAHIAPIRELAALAATGAGQGVQLCTVWQDLAQVETVYGRQATSVVNGHTARVLLAGSADLSTLDAASRTIGDHETVRTSTSIAPDGQRSVSRSPADSRLAPVEYLRQLPPDTAVVLYGRLPPLRVRTTPWWSDRELRAMVREVDGAAASPAPPPVDKRQPAGPPRLLVAAPPTPARRSRRAVRNDAAQPGAAERGPAIRTASDMVPLPSGEPWPIPAADAAADAEELLTAVQDQVDDLTAAVEAQQRTLDTLTGLRRPSS
jgi:type IV secretion system protein VirD4